MTMQLYFKYEQMKNVINILIWIEEEKEHRVGKQIRVSIEWPSNYYISNVNTMKNVTFTFQNYWIEDKREHAGRGGQRKRKETLFVDWILIKYMEWCLVMA